MRNFKDFLIEETLLQILILEGKAQHQVIRQFGDKILQRMEDESKNGPNRARHLIPVNLDAESMRAKRYIVGTSHYKLLGDEVPDLEPNHGSPEHKTSYITKHLSIPEAPGYLNLSDPEDNKTWNQHLNWILTRYAQGSWGRELSGIPRIEDIRYRAIPALSKYHKLVKRGKMDPVSLSKWKNLSDMEAALQNADPLDSTNLHPSDYTLHDENEHWSLVTPHTSEAACSLGHGTNWCTTSGAFEGYSEAGPLYIMIPKKPKDKNEKYQLHIEAEQFMDKTDNPFDDDAVFKNRTMTPKMEALVKLYKSSENPNPNFTKDQLDFLMDTHYGRMLQHPNKDISELAANHPNFGSEPEHIKYALQSQHESIAKVAVNHPLFGYAEGHIDTALLSPHESIAKAAVSHPNFGKGKYYNYYDISKALMSPHESVALAAINHPNFSLEDHHFENAFRSPHKSVHLKAINHPDFTKFSNAVAPAILSKHEEIQKAGVEHPDFGSNSVDLDAALRSKFKPIQQAAINNPYFGMNSSNFINAIGWSDDSIVQQAINHPKFSSDLVKRYPDVFIKSQHPFVRKIAIDHMNSPDFISRHDSHLPMNYDGDMLYRALRSEHEDIAQAVVNHPRFGSADLLSAALKSPHESVAMAAINHPSFNSSQPHIITALQSPHESVALAAANHPGFGDEKYDPYPHYGISNALMSQHKSVALAAINHPNFGSHPDHISEALSSAYKTIQEAAINHPNFGSDHQNIFYALQSPYESVQLAAVKHRKFADGDWHRRYTDINTALQSPHESVALAAANHPSFAFDNGTILDAIQSPHESVKKIAIETFAANERKNRELEELEREYN